MSEKQYSDPIYDLDGKISVSKAIPFGLQHILGDVRSEYRSDSDCSRCGKNAGRAERCSGAVWQW